MGTSTDTRKKADKSGSVFLPGTTYYFSLKTYDEAENVSGRSNSPKGITEAVSAKKYWISGSTGSPELVVTNTYSPPLVSLVRIFGTTIPAEGIGVDFRISSYPAGAEGQGLTKSSETTDSQGVADVSLKLGNIPAEYGVTATCPDCVPEASSVTFTCCGKLPNDHFSQSGVPEWSPLPYARHTISESSGTIGRLGCGLTSLATLVNYYNAHLSNIIPRTNPGELNTYLLELPNYEGYTRASDVVFDVVYKYSKKLVFYLGRYNVGELYSKNDLLAMADAAIVNGSPIIFRIGGHFVLAVGKCGNSYIIADPIGGKERLYNPDDRNDREFLGIRVFGF